MGDVAVDDEWRSLSLDVPANCTNLTLNDIILRPQEPAKVADIDTPAETRIIGETGVDSPVEITVQSAGWDVGDLGHIYVDGVEQSLNGRGYNLVVIDPRSGAVLDRASFDTHLDVEASFALADFVKNLPAGVIVALSVKDEASLNLDEAAVEALRQLGLEGNLRGHFRGSHAGVGVKGAPTGSALELLAEWQPATVVVGAGVTRDEVYFQLRSFAFTSR